MEVEYNDDDKYDFSLHKFKIKFPTRVDEVHHPAELNAYKILQLIVDGKIEIKDHNRALETRNLFIEYKIDKQGNGKITRSGLAKTIADYWLFNIGRSITIVETNFLKYCFNKRKFFSFEDNVPVRNEKNNIGYGFLIPIGRLTDLLNVYEKFIEDRIIKD